MNIASFAPLRGAEAMLASPSFCRRSAEFEPSAHSALAPKKVRASVEFELLARSALDLASVRGAGRECSATEINTPKGRPAGGRIRCTAGFRPRMPQRNTPSFRDTPPQEGN